MTYIEPLNLEVFFINILSGSGEYFVALALFAIVSLSAYFRMSGLTMGFMIMVFLLMFSGYIPASLLILVAIIAGLILGYVVGKIVKN